MMFIQIIDPDERFDVEIGGSGFTCRRITGDQIQKIEEKHTTERRDLATGISVKDRNEYAVNRDILDYIIVGWRRVKHPVTNEDVPCTLENKSRLPGVTKTQLLNLCSAENIPEAKNAPSRESSES